MSEPTPDPPLFDSLGHALVLIAFWLLVVGLAGLTFLLEILGATP